MDIVREILLRSDLDLKSLARLKSVSRTWEATITDPDFIRSYAKKNKSKKFMLFYHDCSTVLVSCNGEKDEEAVVETIKNNFDGLGNLDNLRIVGSCNGLLVGVSSNKPGYYKLFIWNPLTREYKKVPIPGGISKKGSSYGFGYASSDNTHKVLCITPYYDQVRRRQKLSSVHLYSNSTNSWKNLANIEYSLKRCSPIVLVNARLHCMLREENIILAFDIGDEDFKEMAMPDDFKDYSKYLMEWNENLCICSWTARERELSVWVMNYYGVKESWAKTYCIRFDNIMYPDKPCLAAFPRHIFENGQIGFDNKMYDDKPCLAAFARHIFENGQILSLAMAIDKKCSTKLKMWLVCYDSKNHTARNLMKLDCAPNWALICPYGYEETLLSPNVV